MLNESFLTLIIITIIIMIIIIIIIIIIIVIIIIHILLLTNFLKQTKLQYMIHYFSYKSYW